ncbi:hypothetical protein GCG54_00009697 [Colletotrichum gloeosporioides]|uniref:Uncharacterized protein n=1 Tax=Colletotrichum gloeosporioides TaxID=474922 RepID=A0A8H4CFW1_COLGL|nr:uncharacterized protein GCG54_00009697 [Colletotrichum gloeosporioides]KAF3803002.1 hypothetical protein GCG54_00009697 [Colletotrichum gloeosporioides]
MTCYDKTGIVVTTRSAVAGGCPEGDGWPLYGALEPMHFQAETCLAFGLGDHSLFESWTCIWPPVVTVAAATTKEIRSVNRCWCLVSSRRAEQRSTLA